MENKVATLVGELTRVLVQKDVVGVITGYLLRSSAEKMYDWIETLDVCDHEQHRAVEGYRLGCQICRFSGMRYFDDFVWNRVFFRKRDGSYECYLWDASIRHIYQRVWFGIDKLIPWAENETPRRSTGIMAMMRAVLDDW